MGRTEQVHQADEGAAHGRQLRNNHGGLPQISVRGGFHRRPFRLSARRKERKQAPLRRAEGMHGLQESRADHQGWRLRHEPYLCGEPLLHHRAVEPHAVRCEGVRNAYRMVPRP